MPINPTEKRKNQEKNPQLSAQPDMGIMTFGLNEVWKKEWSLPWQWFLKQDAEDTFKLLIDAFNLQGEHIKEVPIINILNILGEDTAFGILQNWGINDNHCQALFQLARKARYDLNNRVEPISHIAPAKDSPTEKLPVDEYYLIRLFLKESSEAEREQAHWLQTLRIWLLIHALYRTEQGRGFNKNINTIASHLRGLLYGEKFDWSDLMLLKPDYNEINCFNSLNSYLINRIAALSSVKKTNRFSRLLNALVFIASYDDKEKHFYTVDTKLQLTPLYQGSSVRYQEPPTEDDQYWLPAIFNQTVDEYEETEEAYALSSVDAEDSYLYQKLSAKSYIIIQSEYLSHLPYSWNRPTPQEIKDLNRWIEKQWVSKDTQSALLAVLVWIALNTGRSLVRTLDLQISPEPGQEWTLHPKSLSLLRIPPIRENGWLPKTSEEHDWVTPTAAYNAITLPSSDHERLKALIQTDSEQRTRFLADLWHQTSHGASIESIFNNAMIGHLQRLKSGMLANALSQKVFENSGSKNLAQMASAHPQSSLTGAFAYGAWDCLKVNSSTEKIHQCLDDALQPSKGEVLAFGSRLSPQEPLLQDAIAKTTEKINAIVRQANPVEYHNAFSSYLMVSLWAATGTRPVQDSFESPTHFNLDEGFVFVNDKAVDQKRQGRLVPLPKKLCEYLKTTYKKHLELLEHALKELNPQLSTEIRALINNQPTGKLPYFFLLKPDSLDWESLLPASIKALELFDWPLQSNLFRQRFAKQLPKLGIEQEIVDSWLGHKDTGIEVYGDFSIRSWLKDLHKNRPHVENAYDSLGFVQLKTWRHPPVFNLDQPSEFNTKDIGIDAREKERQKRKNAVVDSAKNEISLFLAGRLFSELEQGEIDRLEKKLLLLPNGQPHPHGLVRFALLSDQLDEVWNENNERYSVKRRLVHINDDFSPVSSTCPQALSQFRQLKEAFDNAFRETIPSRQSLAENKVLAVLGLIFENRIGYLSMLIDITNNRHFRLVQFKKRFYLEYSENLDPTNILAPVQRHRVTTKTARLLNSILGSKHKKIQIPGLWHSIAKSSGLVNLNEKNNAPEALIKYLSNLVDQANSIELPGIVNAFLSGRVPSSSLNWHDWVRLERGKLLHLPDDDQEPDKEDILDDILKRETIKYNLSALRTLDGSELQVHAKSFNDEIRATLAVYKPANRNKIVKDLGEVINSYQYKVSSSILLLGRWIRDLIKKGKSRTGRAYAADSPNRYFSALAGYFEQLAYNRDLLDMESDEITDLYQAFLSATESLEGAYHSDRLISFHTFCSKEGADDPDWNELNLPAAGRRSSPGILLETDYQKCLRIILNNKIIPFTQKLHMAFLLLLGFRFGLRAKEAVGLRRDDWVERHGQLYLLIRNNQYRTLKTDCSRRLVPLLFELSDEERSLIEQVFAQYESIYHDDHSKALLSIENQSINPDIVLIRRSLIALLKQITGNPKMVFHHLRHAFSNATSMALYHLEMKHWARFFKDSYYPEVIRKTTLSTQNSPGSRNSMAAARLLGHSHPKTDAISYQHFIDEWANSEVNMKNSPSETELNKAIVIDKPDNLTNQISTLPLENITEKYQPLTLSYALRLMSLVSNGKPFQTAGNRLLLPPEAVDKFAILAERIGKKTRRESDITPLDWLYRIPRSSWQRLIEFTVEIEKKPIQSPSSLKNPEDLINMIGRTRQLTLWKEEQFKAVKSYTEYLKLSPDDFKIASYNPDSPLIPVSQNFNFDIDETIARADLDPAVSNESIGTSHKNRINLIFRENKQHAIRNSYQLAACLAAIVNTSWINP